ncbi:hypothetical protein ACP4OV_000534 [Aristida adscensionis]
MSFKQPAQESGAPSLCAAGCGFFGSPATHHMCSVCYRKHCLAAAATVVATGAAAPAVAAPNAGVSSAQAEGVAEAAAVCSSAPGAAKKTTACPNRCAACLKKVGLTRGFVCRCGKTFCGSHRYAEEHGCTFDFKAAGRGVIARNNPLVKGEKLLAKILIASLSSMPQW